MWTGFSLEPDESMRWIYDQRDSRYYSKEAEDLRDRRAYALRHTPRWMIEQAEINDAMQGGNKQGGGEPGVV